MHNKEVCSVLGDEEGHVGIKCEHTLIILDGIITQKCVLSRQQFYQKQLKDAELYKESR